MPENEIKIDDENNDTKLSIVIEDGIAKMHLSSKDYSFKIDDDPEELLNEIKDFPIEIKMYILTTLSAIKPDDFSFNYNGSNIKFQNLIAVISFFKKSNAIYEALLQNNIKNIKITKQHSGFAYALCKLYSADEIFSICESASSFLNPQEEIKPDDLLNYVKSLGDNLPSFLSNFELIPDNTLDANLGKKIISILRKEIDKTDNKLSTQDDIKHFNRLINTYQFLFYFCEGIEEFMSPLEGIQNQLTNKLLDLLGLIKSEKNKRLFKALLNSNLVKRIEDFKAITEAHEIRKSSSVQEYYAIHQNIDGKTYYTVINKDGEICKVQTAAYTTKKSLTFFSKIYDNLASIETSENLLEEGSFENIPEANTIDE